MVENGINEFDFPYFQKRLCWQPRHATRLIGAKQEVSKVYFTVKFFVFTILCKQLKKKGKTCLQQSQEESCFLKKISNFHLSMLRFALCATTGDEYT